jgi:transposase-like protein
MGQQKEEERVRWQGILSEQTKSGKSIAAFCRDGGLPVWQFYEWKKRLRQAGAAKFVAVEVTGTGVPAEKALLRGVAIEVRLSRGKSVLVEPGFDASHLRRLLSVLESEA